MVDIMRELIENPENVRPIHLEEMDIAGQQNNLDDKKELEPLDNTELSDEETESTIESKNVRSDGCVFKPIVVDEEDQMLQHARSLSFEQRIVFDKIVTFCKSVLRSNNGAAIVPKPPKLIVTGKIIKCFVY